MAREVDQLGRMIDYLHRHDARVAGVFLPLGSWHGELPYANEYRRRVTSLCGKKSAPLLDLATLLADDEFSDSVHFRYTGERKIHARLASLAVAYLQRAGTLAPDAMQPGTSEPRLLADDAGASPLPPAPPGNAPVRGPAGAESPIVPTEFLQSLEAPPGSAR